MTDDQIEVLTALVCAELERRGISFTTKEVTQFVRLRHHSEYPSAESAQYLAGQWPDRERDDLIDSAG